MSPPRLGEARRGAASPEAGAEGASEGGAVAITGTFDPADMRVAREGRRTFGRRSPGPHRRWPRGVSARPGGRARGGLTTGPARDRLLVDPLWAAQGVRGRKLASRLLGATGRAGLARGCDHAQLAALDAQARRYERHGSAVLVELEGYANGHRPFNLRKRPQR